MSFIVKNAFPILGADTKIEGFQSKPTAIGSAVKVIRQHSWEERNLEATATSFTIHIANDNYQITAVEAIFSTASSSGTLDVEVASDGTAVGSGTAVLTAPLSLAGTANTKVSGTLSSNVDDLQVAAGQHVNVILAGTLTSLANCCVTIHCVRV